MEHQVDASEVMCLYNPIMQSINAKLDSMLERNQVTGKDAAQVYLHALESTLHEVVVLLLGADQRKLILAQTGKENAGTNLIVQQTENAALEGNNIPKQGSILDQELLKLIGETSLIPKQGDLIDAQVNKEVANTANTTQQTYNLSLDAVNIPKEGVILDQNLVKLIAETAIVPKQGNLLDAQVAKESASTSQITQQTYNLGLEALNIPKQGVQIDQQTAKLLGETNLIPKQSQLIDAQITELLSRNLKVDAEKALLEQQRLNLIIEGTNLDKQTDLITEQIRALQEDVKGKAMDIKVKGTQAELNRAQAYKVAAERAAMKGRAYAEILSVMVGSYNTAIAHSLDLASAFDASACNSAANNALSAAQDSGVNVDKFV